MESRIRWALAACAAAAAATGCAGDPPPSPRDATPGSVHFVVMTYNLNQPNLKTETIEEIGAPNADIVCLQEVTAAWRQRIEPRYAQQYPYMVFAPNEHEGGLAVFSHYPLEDKGLVILAGDQAQWHPGLVVRANTPGGPVDVIDVHLRAIFEGNSNALTNYATHGSDHVQEINIFLNHADDAAPVIVGGDFNEGPSGASVRALEARGFVNPLPLYRPGQYTWRGASVGGTNDLIEDYVLVDAGFDALNAWVIRGGASDHLPVLTHVQMRHPILPAPPHAALASKLVGGGSAEHLVPFVIGQFTPANSIFDPEHQSLVHTDAQP